MVDQQSQVGQPSLQSLPQGSAQILRADPLGAQVVQELHGRYAETARNKALMFGYTTAQTLTASNTTYTGHGLYNGSTTVNLALLKVSIGISVTSASMTGIALGYSSGQGTTVPTSQTAATQFGNCFLGGPAPQATCFKAATLLVAGIPIFPLLHNTAAINTVGADQFVVDMEGAIIVPPGGVLTLLALGAASAASAVTAAFLWEEIPV